jgi:hypothetical protein
MFGMLSCSRIMQERAYCKAHPAPAIGTGILKIGQALGAHGIDALPKRSEAARPRGTPP